jgi:hypothetical protein
LVSSSSLVWALSRLLRAWSSADWAAVTSAALGLTSWPILAWAPASCAWAATTFDWAVATSLVPPPTWRACSEACARWSEALALLTAFWALSMSWVEGPAEVTAELLLPLVFPLELLLVPVVPLELPAVRLLLLELPLVVPELVVGAPMFIWLRRSWAACRLRAATRTSSPAAMTSRLFTPGWAWLSLPWAERRLACAWTTADWAAAMSLAVGFCNWLSLASAASRAEAALSRATWAAIKSARAGLSRVSSLTWAACWLDCAVASDATAACSSASVAPSCTCASLASLLARVDWAVSTADWAAARSAGSGVF